MQITAGRTPLISILDAWDLPFRDSVGTILGRTNSWSPCRVATPAHNNVKAGSVDSSKPTLYAFRIHNVDIPKHHTPPEINKHCKFREGVSVSSFTLVQVRVNTQDIQHSRLQEALESVTPRFKKWSFEPPKESLVRQLRHFPKTNKLEWKRPNRFRFMPRPQPKTNWILRNTNV